MSSLIANVIIYGLMALWILFPGTVLRLFRYLHPTRTYSGWQNSERFIRTSGLILLAFWALLRWRLSSWTH